MAMTGFDMIMRDRIIKYKSSLKKLNPPINFQKNNLLDENRWDTQLMDLVINNDNNFSRIFPNKSQWQLMWKERKNMRNNAAHGKPYKISYFDIESFYSWIMQAFYALYPVTALETLIEDINIFFDASKTPENEPYDYIVEKSLFISTEEELKEVFYCLYKIYDNNYYYSTDNIIPSKAINILSEIFNNFNDKKIFINVLNDFIKNLIESSHEYGLFISRNGDFITDLLCSNLKILSNMTDYEKYCLFNNMPFNIFNCNKLYRYRIIDEKLLTKQIASCSLCSLELREKKDIEYIYTFVEEKIEKICKELLSSNSFEETNYIINEIPFKLLNSKYASIIEEAYTKNNKVREENNRINYLMDYIKNNELL